MKVLLLSVTAGQGHHSTAKAVADELVCRGIENEVLDFFQYTSKFMFAVVEKGYLWATKYAAPFYGPVYTELEKDGLLKKLSSSEVVIENLADKFVSYIEENSPDVIVSTHIFASQVLNYMKRTRMIRVPVISIVTDYTLHPFWEDVYYTDYVVTASELLNYRCEKRGLSTKKILPFGIPVKERFNVKIDKAEAKRQLGLDVDKKCILMMAGSMGYGNMEEVIKEIDEIETDFQVIVVCGNNEKLCKKLSEMKFKKEMKFYGYVDNVDVMMDACECIVTKPGGLTTTEALCKGIPMIMVNPIPGQEDRNAEFLSNTGVAMRATETFPVDEAIYYMFNTPGRLQMMEEAMKKIAHPDSTKRLCDFIEKL